MNIELDRWELLYLLEGCSIGSHLRQGIWRRAVDEFYGKLTEDERMAVYMYAKRDITRHYIPRKVSWQTEIYKPVGSDDFFEFLACFNPANRYHVHVVGEVDGKEQGKWVNAFWWDGKYHLGFYSYCAEEYITETMADEDFKKCGLACMWHDKCARYSEGAENIGMYANSKCDWFINTDTPHGADFKHF